MLFVFSIFCEHAQITEKSADGWWEGRIGDRMGSFPASFVEEIKSKEEGIQLMRLMKKGKHPQSVAEESGMLITLSGKDCI